MERRVSREGRRNSVLAAAAFVAAAPFVVSGLILRSRRPLFCLGRCGGGRGDQGPAARPRQQLRRGRRSRRALQHWRRVLLAAAAAAANDDDDAADDDDGTRRGSPDGAVVRRARVPAAAAPAASQASEARRVSGDLE